MEGNSSSIDACSVLHLYRIAQESITNAARHGHARHVNVELNVAGEQVSLTIEDDGIGMSASSVEPAGLGLRIMQYRARMLSGKVTVRTSPGHGVTVRCDCPIRPLVAAQASPAVA